MTNADLTNDGFPFATSKEIEIGYTNVIANRLTYVGELGWEIFIPTEHSLDVFDNLIKSGKEFNLKPAGIVKTLDLLKPRYLPSATYGHFGRKEASFTWEKTDKAKAIKKDAGL